MTQGSPPSSSFDLQLLAAQLRRQSDDLSMYAGFLLNVLSGLPGDLIEVRREGRLKARLGRRGEPAVLSLVVVLGDRRYGLERTDVGRPLEASIQHASGGVVMSNKRVTVDEWSVAMAGELVRVANANTAAAAVLARLTL